MAASMEAFAVCCLCLLCVTWRGEGHLSLRMVDAAFIRVGEVDLLLIGRHDHHSYKSCYAFCWLTRCSHSTITPMLAHVALSVWVGSRGCGVCLCLCVCVLVLVPV